MTSRNLKLLASTAFVAAASVGHAADTTTSSTTTIANTDATNYISSSVVVSTTGIGPAIVISGTGTGDLGDALLGVSSSAVLRSDSVTGTVSLGADAAVSGTLTIVNEGSIINTLAGGSAISTTATQIGAQPAVVITNSGTISGSIDNGTGDLTYTNTGTHTGAINTTGTGTDTITVNGGTQTGDISLGDGANNLTVSASTFTGDYTGGTGADTVTINNDSTVTGNIALSTGTDALDVSNSRINGNVTSGNGVTTVTLYNSVVSGTMTDSQAGDSDVLNINGTDSFTTLGAISGFEDVNINTDMTINHGLAGAATVDIASGKTVTVNNSFQATGALTNNGTLNIAGGKSVQADSYSSTGGILGIGIVSSNTTTGRAQLILDSATTSAATSFTINVASTSGYIANGTSYTIVDGGGGGNASGTLTTASAGVYTFSLQENGTNSDDLDLIIGRVSTSSVVAGADNQAAANVLDNLGADATGELATLQGVIGSQSTSTGVQNVLESLVPSIDGAGAASVNMAVDAGNQVSNRLASVRSNGYGVATGDAMANQHMWVQGFGSVVEQDDKNGARGYDASSAGMSFGVDTDTLVDGMTTGAAFTYGKGNVDSNASGGASTDIDTYALTGYGSRVMDNGVFVNGQLGFAYNQYDMERTVSGIGLSKGDTNGWQATAKVETGRDYAVGGLTMTPLASLQYTYLDMDSYTETGAGGASLYVDPESMSTLDAGLGGEMSYAMPLNDGGTLKPSVHAKYIYRMGDDSMGTTSSFVGGGAAFSTSGVKSDRSSLNVGAGMLLTTVGGTDLSINYDADIRSSLTGHTGQLKARWAF